MALLLRDLTLDLSFDEKRLPLEAARQLGVAADKLRNFRIVRRSIDARKKSRIRRIYAVEFSSDDEAALLRKHGSGRLEKVSEAPEVLSPRVSCKHHALVVGTGPAGLFAARRLAESGVRVTLIDRGRELAQRVGGMSNISGPQDSLMLPVMFSSVRVGQEPSPMAN